MSLNFFSSFLDDRRSQQFPPPDEGVQQGNGSFTRDILRNKKEQQIDVLNKTMAKLSHFYQALKSKKHFWMEAFFIHSSTCLVIAC